MPTPVSCIVREGIVRLRRSPASCRKASYAYAGLLHRAGRCRTPTPVSCIVHEGVVRLRCSPASCREASYAYDRFLGRYIAPSTQSDYTHPYQREDPAEVRRLLQGRNNKLS